MGTPSTQYKLETESDRRLYTVELDEEENKLNASQTFPPPLAEPILNNYVPDPPPPATSVPASPIYHAPHRNPGTIFLGCLVGIGMVLEFLEGGTLYDYLKQRAPSSRIRLRDFHNQLLDALTHLHAYGLSHGDLSMLNVQVLERRGESTLKLFDFGRSVSADSALAPPDGDPVDIWAYLNPDRNEPHVEQILPGTRPFSAPEILRGECHDARLADAYSFGIVCPCDLKSVNAYTMHPPKGVVTGTT